jgi:large subunit ribosomal protein L30
MTEQKKPTRQAKPKKGARLLKITLVRSTIGTTYRHKATVVAMGLRHLHQSVEQTDTPQLRGMLAKVGHLVLVEDAPAGTGKEK